MYENEHKAKFEDLIGKTLVVIKGTEKGSDYIKFITANGEVFAMYHSQDCCESAWVEDVVGDINDLLNTPIMRASEDTNRDGPPAPNADESWTWTFYNIATFKGHVTIRWFGTSNGYYSESVDFVKITTSDNYN